MGILLIPVCVFGIIVAGLIWHVRKYGDEGFFHEDSPPSIINDPPKLYQKGNLEKWAEDVRKRTEGP